MLPLSFLTRLIVFRQVETHKQIRHLDEIQKTLPLVPREKVQTQFKKIDENLAEVTKLIFPYDVKLASEMVKEEHTCPQQ